MTVSAPGMTVGQDSLLRRLSNTPLRDVLRGRLTGRLSIANALAAADLPAPLAACVRDVVRRTRLWRLEKIAVARELIAHFQDGQAAGANIAELIASFGDPAQAAVLIRRAKKRNRPLIWKAAKGVEAIAAFTLALGLLLYTIQAVRLYSGAPNIARNYLGEWNRAALAVPADQRAWPEYRAAHLALRDRWPARRKAVNSKPGGSEWPVIAGYVRANEEAVEQYRRAAMMPKLGVVLGASLDVDYVLCGRGQPLPATLPAPDPNPEFISVLLPPLSVLREGAKLVTGDAYLAAAAGDADRTRTDVAALFGIAAHARETGFLISDLVALAIASGACDTIGTLLRDHPRLLSDANLTSLAHRVVAVGGDGDLRPRLASERAVLDDMLQRCFTDDGAGDGLPRPELLKHLAALSSSSAARTWGAPDRAFVLVMPALSPFMAGRRELRSKYLDLLARSEAEIATPLWQRGGKTVDDDLAALQGSAAGWVRYAPIAMQMPSPLRVGLIAEYFRQNRDATLVAIALEFYHRRHGTWPAALAELTPQFLPGVPLDRYDGGPIKYRVVDGQPLLYSVGVDRNDDGGRLPDKSKLPCHTSDAPNDLARLWQPSADPRQPACTALPDGDWVLWPPVE